MGGVRRRGVRSVRSEKRRRGGVRRGVKRGVRSVRSVSRGGE